MEKLAEFRNCTLHIYIYEAELEGEVGMQHGEMLKP
jgi:hypothetical protein